LRAYIFQGLITTDTKLPDRMLSAVYTNVKVTPPTECRIN